MSPTYTMSAHLCKQIYASWRETRPSPSNMPSPGVQAPNMTSYFPRSPSPEKRSMDSDRSDAGVPMSRSPSSSSWPSYDNGIKQLALRNHQYAFTALRIGSSSAHSVTICTPTHFTTPSRDQPPRAVSVTSRS
ncbi:ste12 interacting protein [Colletotrichum camelliae]|nr:ste12 interacting protein [Colletotrichum camelliae]KAH0427016.1 ste12 interacting protein [Colletotrichum camelliae]